GDEQVKIRGYRIELGEIEAAYRDCPLLRNVAVVKGLNSRGESVLVAYYVPTNALTATTTALRDYGASRIPGYMVPSRFVPLEQLEHPHLRVATRVLAFAKKTRVRKLPTFRVAVKAQNGSGLPEWICPRTTPLGDARV